MLLENTYFEKISFEQFKKDWESVNKEVNMSDEEILKMYNKIKLPQRSTTGSAGYDFFIPFDVTIKQLGVITVPTGIRCHIDDGWVLTLAPRSGIGFKTGAKLANTIGVIDSDYVNADNEGHIMVKITNDCIIAKDIALKAGKAFCQGIFLMYGVTNNDDANGIRVGGFGSTNA